MRLTCIIFLSIFLGIKTSAQEGHSFPCLTLNASKSGVIFSNNDYFNKIGILLQDTCSSFNRFDRNFYSGQSGLVTPLLYYNAIIVDSTTAISIEAQLKGVVTQRSKAMKIGVANASKKLRKFIRLYAGFVNEIGDTCVVIQYVTNREYAKGKYYSKQLDLIAAKNRPLRFVVFEKKMTEWAIRSSFPYDFL
jgi:hypothetical protein